jgi:hypothetical protein
MLLLSQETTGFLFNTASGKRDPNCQQVFIIANNCIKWRVIFEVLSQHGTQEKIAKNLRASPFNKDL